MFVVFAGDNLLLTGFFLVIYCSKGEPFECSRTHVYCPHIKQCESFQTTSCRFKCPFNEASCDNGNKCYNAQDRCNGIADCIDRSDELFCCNRFQKSCDGGEKCYAAYEECDGLKDCKDGKDEKNCRKPCLMFSCDEYNDECYGSTETCDGHWHCSNGKDEEGCFDSSDNSDTSSDGPGMGTIIGIIVGVIAFTILVLCCKKAVQNNNDQTADPSGSVAYHSAANYRQSGNFQACHNNTAENSTYPNSSTPYPVAIGENGTSNSTPAAFQSSHHYNSGSTTQPSNMPQPGYTSIYGPTAQEGPSAPGIGPSTPGMGPSYPGIGPPGPGMGPSAPVIGPSAPVPHGYMGPNAAPYGPNTGSSLPYPTAATAYPYPVAVPMFPPSPSAGDPEPSPVTVPPPSYDSLYPENKTRETQNPPE